MTTAINPNNNKKKNTKVALVKRSVRPSGRKLAYTVMATSGVPKQVAKEIAGYNPTSDVELYAGTTDQQREKALKACGISLYSQFKTLKEIQDDKTRSCPSDRIHAVKTINSMVPGFTAPAEIKVNSTAIIAEFKDMSSGDLANLAHMLNVNTSVPFRCTDSIEEAQVIDPIEDSDEQQGISNPLDGEDE